VSPTAVPKLLSLVRQVLILRKKKSNSDCQENKQTKPKAVSESLAKLINSPHKKLLSNLESNIRLFNNHIQIM